MTTRRTPTPKKTDQQRVKELKEYSKDLKKVLEEWQGRSQELQSQIKVLEIEAQRDLKQINQLKMDNAVLEKGNTRIVEDIVQARKEKLALEAAYKIIKAALNVTLTEQLKEHKRAIDEKSP